MFGSKSVDEESGMLRLQKGIARDRRRLQQRLELVDADRPAKDDPQRRLSGRLYQVFVDLGEASP